MKFPKLCKAIEHTIDRWGPIEGRTRLLKLVYLADFGWAKNHSGKPYTEAKYYRWNHGPFSREVFACVECMDGIEIVESSQTWDGGSTYVYSAGESTRLAEENLDPEFLRGLNEVAAEWRTRPLRDLLEHVYAEQEFSKREFGEAIFG